MDRLNDVISSAKPRKRRIYACNIQGSGGTKMTDLALRTDDCDNVVLMETNCHVGAENRISMGNTVALVSTENKEVAFGTAILSRDYNRQVDKVSYKSKTNEIIAVTQHVSDGVVMTIVGAYRSPHMRAKETREFYNEINELVVERKKKGDQIILVAMDDNSSKKDGLPYKRLEATVSNTEASM